ncbi:MAG: hypothetical protein C0449_05985 [Polaromonas sp.]|nr:hypothetical protein [Polaromonas sp.]
MLASKVQFTFEMKDDSLVAFAYLVPCYQRRPSLSGFSDSDGDLFLGDIKLIEDARLLLREDYETALKSDADPRTDPVLADRRSQIWKARRRGSLTIYSTVEGEDLPLGSEDKWMPHARMSKMIFTVDRIARTECRVFVRSLVAVERESGKCSSTVDLPKGRVDIERDQLALGWAVGQKLSKAMEERTVLQADIRLEFSWIDGTLGRMTLLEAPVEYLDLVESSNADALQLHSTNTAEGEAQEVESEEDESPVFPTAQGPFPRLHLAFERASAELKNTDSK